MKTHHDPALQQAPITASNTAPHGTPAGIATADATTADINTVQSCPPTILQSPATQRLMTRKVQPRDTAPMDMPFPLRSESKGASKSVSRRSGNIKTIALGGGMGNADTDGRDDPLAGTQYEVVDCIGNGGMGSVYSAKHRSLGHYVAIKVINEVTSEAMDRARIEAQAGARLNHPNLVSVTEVGITANGQRFIAMELLDGATLYRRLSEVDGGPLPLARTIDITCQLLSGLGAIHDAGMVHRDIKPQNIFICSDAATTKANDKPHKEGTVKVLDLGLAKIVEQRSLTPARMRVPTAPHHVMGTPRYLAPEQAAALPIDARADLYAVGCILYRMVCGRGPFDHARTYAEMHDAHCHETPKPPSTHLLAGIPPALDQLIMQCLAKTPAQRPDSAETLAAELRRIELEVRTSETYGQSYVTRPHKPSTTLMESIRLWNPPQAMTAPANGSDAARSGFTVRQAVGFAAVCLVLGMALSAVILTALGFIGGPR